MDEVREAVEKRAVLAVDADAGVVEAPAGCHGQAVGHAERIERVDAGIGVVRVGQDRVQKAVRFVDDEREGRSPEASC